MVCGWPTMPKRGAAEIAMRRSRSSLRPVISACTGAWKPSAAALAGMSCTRPSVIRNAPATRSTGTSDSAEDSAPNSLVPSVSPSAWPASTTRTSSPLIFFKAIDQRFLRLRGFACAVAEILARALVDHDGGDRGQRLAVLAGEGGIGERQQRSAPARRRAPRRRASAGTAAASTRASDHSTIVGTRARCRRAPDRCGRAPDEAGSEARCPDNLHRWRVTSLIARAVRSAPARAPGRPCSCRSACTSRC